MLKLLLGLLVATLMFAAYGCREIQEAMKDGRSPRDGIEALVVAVIFLALLVLMVVRERRRARSRGDID